MNCAGCEEIERLLYIAKMMGMEGLGYQHTCA